MEFFVISDAVDSQAVSDAPAERYLGGKIVSRNLDEANVLAWILGNYAYLETQEWPQVLQVNQNCYVTVWTLPFPKISKDTSE